ncbi:MAG: hypothetical protein HYU28_01420 [Actinobacteria bacterium]|nr:hypothetical protein [Actinomycetota bacterium]
MKKILTLTVLALAVVGLAPRAADAGVVGARNSGRAHAEMNGREDLASGRVQFTTTVVDLAETADDVATVVVRQTGQTCAEQTCDTWSWAGDVVVPDETLDVDQYPDSSIDIDIEVPVREHAGPVPTAVADGTVRFEFNMSATPDATAEQHGCGVDITRRGQAHAHIEGARTWTTIGEWTVTRSVAAPKAGC